MDVVRGPDSENLISQWIRDYEKDLLRLCCMYLKDVSLAEDAVQETFLKAYRHLAEFRGDASPKTWLVRIAVNVCKDMRKSAWFRHLKNVVGLDRMELAQPQEDWTLRSFVAEAIMDLPTPLREAVLLHDYEGLSQTEIARMLRLSVPTVHRRLKKSYELLRNVLKEEDAYDA
ncbi:MAG: sigma-70 family RNA polymerase sigma factor [Clostridia bacterium]|nr:sigma-70 family RNA polymerase sigma factor [Clostridia bacterium]